MPPVSEIIAFLEMLVSHAPAIEVSSAKTYADIAHGKGGLEKVAKATGDLLNVFNAALTGAAPDASTSPQPSPAGSSASPPSASQ